VDRFQGALVHHLMEFADGAHDIGLGLVIGRIMQHLAGLDTVGFGGGLGGFNQRHRRKLSFGQRIGIQFGL
jgi:hypothetical protein